MKVTRDQLAAALGGVRLLKATTVEEDRFVLGVAYPSGKVDGHRHFAKSRAVEQTAWGFLSDGRQIGIQHADGSVGAGQVVESYIYRGPAWTTQDATGQQQLIKAGDWLLGVVFDPVTWPLVKSGRVTGWSIDGGGRLRRTTPDAVEQR